MMTVANIRVGLTALLNLLLVPCVVQGQCQIEKDAHGQVTTTCEAYVSQGNTNVVAPAHKLIRYLGSEFLTFPVWQKGTLQLDRSGQEIACQLAYNVQTQTVLCQLDKNAKDTWVKPYAFSLNGSKFGQQLAKGSSLANQPYTTVLHDGPTRLLKSVTSRLVSRPISNGYEKGGVFDGYYQTEERYYIQKGDAYPQLTNLSQRSLLSILFEQGSQLTAQLVRKQATTEETVKLLMYYDSLNNIANTGKPLLGRDALFTTFLHRHVSYPNRAWNNGVYSRVYAAFEVNQTGQLINISLLSPGNTDFGFDQSVQQALRKLAQVKPMYIGKYVLPVCFTYTNRQAVPATYVPVNTLPPEGFEGRTILDEMVVPVTVSRPISQIREVWGSGK